MKAYWIRPQGDRPVVELRETPSPEPKAGQVRVRVHAASLNRGELIVRHGIHATPGKPAVEAKPGGAECAGEVERVGAGVTNIKPGDRVMGRCAGGFAEFALMDAREAVPVPARFTLRIQSQRLRATDPRSDLAGYLDPFRRSSTVR